MFVWIELCSYELGFVRVDWVVFVCIWLCLCILSFFRVD